ncbi:MAG TPA: hypothetical protein VNX47_07205 [Nevskia sp.]|nr:hypothetical protein [Nevskia sp.]
MTAQDLRTPKIAPKIAICGVGFVGKALARLALSKGWTIVAAYNRAGGKIGQDLGRVAGLDKDLGVIVEDVALADFAAPGADIALIAAGNTLASNFAVYEKFLSAGIDVLCHASESYIPRWCNPELAEKIDQLAKRHGVTFTGSGIWDMSRLWAGLIVTGPCAEIRSLVHSSTTEIVRQGAQYLPLFGVGLRPDEFKQRFGKGVGPFTFYHLPAVAVLERLGCTISDRREWLAPIIWNEAIYCPEVKKEFQAGCCVGLQVCVDVHSKEGITVESRIDYRLFKAGEIEEMRWRVIGKPGMEIRVVREDSGLASASSLINRVPDVLAARPGIVEVMEMGPARPVLSV